MNFLFCLSLLVIVDGLQAAHDKEWTYSNPEEWAKMFPDDCGGSEQSPIDIVTDKLEPQPYLDLLWKNYEIEPKSMKLKNNGHTMQLDVEYDDAEKVPFITADGFENDKYVFEQLHFHWGADNTQGSEHTLDGVGLPLEMHMVHYKQEYGSLGEAVKKSDGILVIGSFYNVTEKQSDALQNLLKVAPQVRKEQSSLEIEKFLLSDFEVVTDKPSYASYIGSLTTPKCLEVVTWFVAIKPYDISNSQMEAIRSLRMAHDDDHVNRPTQLLNGRTVYLFSKE